MGECRGRIEARRGDGNGGSTVVSRLKQREKKGEGVVAAFKEQRGGFACCSLARSMVRGGAGRWRAAECTGEYRGARRRVPRRCAAMGRGRQGLGGRADGDATTRR